MSTTPGHRYARTFLAGWGAMDFNGHMANTAYLDMAADVRMAFFEEHGFPVSEFQKRGFGPVIRKDELEYFREVHLHQMVTVTLAVAAMRGDGTRFVLESELFLPGGERAATVRSTGGWLDLTARKLMAPPQDLLAVLHQIPRAAHFEELPGRTRRHSP
jgi:acyl-CoA thioester hydrolase